MNKIIKTYFKKKNNPRILKKRERIGFPLQKGNCWKFAQSGLGHSMRPQCIISCGHMACWNAAPWIPATMLAAAWQFKTAMRSHDFNFPTPNFLCVIHVAPGCFFVHTTHRTCQLASQFPYLEFHSCSCVQPVVSTPIDCNLSSILHFTQLSSHAISW